MEEAHKEACFLTSTASRQKRNERAFMGTTHALSGLAVFLLLTAFLPQTVIWFLGSGALSLLIVACINLIGGCLAVDLDNTASTAKSSLGLLGDLLSSIFRATSVVVQTTIRSGRDNKEPNPHRGFYHTVPAALLIGGLAVALTHLSGGITLPFIGALSLGGFFALVFTWLNLHMALAGLARGLMKKVKKGAGPAGELVAFALSLLIATSLFVTLPKNSNFWWLGASIAVGMVIHSLGDCFTTAGSPILFPLPIKGKLWWNVRFLPIHAGGVVEKWIFMPSFCLLILLAVFTIALR